jgi:hypothetical protein
MICLLLLSTLPSFATEEGKPTLRVSGTLKGYFLTKSARITIRSVHLADRQQPKPLTVLRPVWSSYYLTGTVHTNESTITAVKVGLGQQLLWQQKFTAPRSDVVFPHAPGKFIGVPARDGLPLSVEVTRTDGQRQRINLQPLDVRWGALPPLRIDWLDFLRIAELRHLLRVKGDQIWQGFRADRVPFLLEGDRQWILVNHPKPPKGFTRYHGQLPVPLSVFIGTSAPPILNPHGEVVLVNGVYTAAVRYRPFWYALPEGGGIARSSEEALQRWVVMIHEAFHAWMLNRKPLALSFSGRSFRLASAETIALRAHETDALVQALAADNTETVKSLAMEFLALRMGRRASDKQQPAILTVERNAELLEGLAYYVMAEATRIAATTQHPALLLKTDPFFEGYEPIDPLQWLTGATEIASGMAIDTERSLPGYAQVLLLDRLGVKWKEQVLKTGTSLEALLAQAVGWTRRSASDQQKMIQRLKAEDPVGKTVIAMQQQLDDFTRTGSAQLEHVRKGQRAGFWILASLSGAPLPNPPTDLQEGDWLPGFQTNSGHRLEINVQRLCWLSRRIAAPKPIIELFIPLDPKKDLLWLRRQGTTLSLKCQEMMIRAENADLQPVPHSLRLRVQPYGQLPNVRPLKGGRPTMRQTKWMLIPLLLVVSATHAQAQIEGQSVEETVTGLFEEAGTGQQQVLTLDLFNSELNPPGDWVTLPTESYLVQVDAYDTYTRLHELTLTDHNGTVLDQQVADPPASALHTVGVVFFGGRYRVQPTITATHNAFGSNHCTWVFVGGITFVPQPNLTLSAMVVNGSYLPNPPPPLASAYVKFYRSSRPNQFQVVQTNPSGVATYEVSPHNDWMIEVTMPVPFCSVRKGPYTMKGKTMGLADTVILYPHEVTEGKVVFQGNGIRDPNSVTVEALQGGTVIATAGVSTAPNPDGSFTYAFPYPMNAGSYTVKATYTLTGQVVQNNLTVPDHCTQAHSDPFRPGTSYAINPKGPHSKVTGPTLTLQSAPPMGGGGG